jgi:hypothetical protein
LNEPKDVEDVVRSCNGRATWSLGLRFNLQTCH